MQNQARAGSPIVLETPKQRRSLLRWLTIPTAVGAFCGLGWAWQQGLKPSLDYFAVPVRLSLVEVDRGDIVQLVIENGTLESASDSTVKCQVEAMVGLTGGSTGTGAAGAGARTGTTGGSGQSGGASGAQATKAATPAATSKSSRSSGTSKSGGSSQAGKSSSASSSSSSGGGGGSASSSSSSSADATTSASGKPVIRSFSYTVIPHTPLKTGSAGSGSASSALAATKNATTASGGGGNRGGGGGRGGRGGGTGMMEEKPGATRIISILPQGTKVKAGDLVCELDSATFRDELKVQQIRHLQAKAWVEQATAILEVNKITLREYRDGIFPQDLQLVRQYIQTCQTQHDIAVRNLKWSSDLQKKGLRTRSQLIADQLSVQQTEIALSEANGMRERLEKFTGPKIIKSLEAKLASILTDKLAQDASFALETERLERLEKNIAHCTLRAPADGVVVYVNQTNGWGRVESAIEQGVTVRQDQPIFQLPDPKRLRVKARINETKVAMIQPGQNCEIVIDAFPERKLRGKVSEVTAIATPVNGPFSDVRVYFAFVNIEQGFDDLRPGLSAEVNFLNDQRLQVERLPIASVREFGGESFVAVPERSSAAKSKTPYRWQKVELGLRGPDFVEVLSGVRQGDSVVADPFALEAPQLETSSGTAPVASLAP
jgi:HlyD family secretion protein